MTTDDKPAPRTIRDGLVPLGPEDTYNGVKVSSFCMPCRDAIARYEHGMQASARLCADCSEKVIRATSSVHVIGGGVPDASYQAMFGIVEAPVEPAAEILRLMADRDLCEPCATRMANLEPGFVGTFICAECGRRHAEKDAADKAARKTEGHPAPWAWNRGGNGDDWLRAANGEIVVDAGDGCTWPANGYVGELVRAAPEMKAILGEIIERLDQRPDDTCVLCGKFHYHDDNCPYRLGDELLARIDAAGK